MEFGFIQISFFFFMELFFFEAHTTLCTHTPHNDVQVKEHHPWCILEFSTTTHHYHHHHHHHRNPHQLGNREMTKETSSTKTCTMENLEPTHEDLSLSSSLPCNLQPWRTLAGSTVSSNGRFQPIKCHLTPYPCYSKYQ